MRPVLPLALLATLTTAQPVLVVAAVAVVGVSTSAVAAETLDAVAVATIADSSKFLSESKSSVTIKVKVGGVEREVTLSKTADGKVNYSIAGVASLNGVVTVCSNGNLALTPNVPTADGIKVFVVQPTKEGSLVVIPSKGDSLTVVAANGGPKDVVVANAELKGGVRTGSVPATPSKSAPSAPVPEVKGNITFTQADLSTLGVPAAVTQTIAVSEAQVSSFTTN